MMKMILSAPLLLLADPISARSIVEKPPKRIYVSDRPVADVAQCLTAKLQWFAPPAMAAAAQGNMRIQFSHAGRVFSDLNILRGPQTKIEVRGVSGGRFSRSVEGCLVV